MDTDVISADSNINSTVGDMKLQVSRMRTRGIKLKTPGVSHKREHSPPKVGSTQKIRRKKQKKQKTLESQVEDVEDVQALQDEHNCLLVNDGSNKENLSMFHDPSLISSNLEDVVPLAQLPELNFTLSMRLCGKRIDELFPVQAAVLRWLLNRLSPKSLIGGQRDLCVTSPTGSGKTLSYVLPILHLLSQRFVPRIQALIVVPTQDLAVQVWNVFNDFCQNSQLKSGLVCGGEKFEEEQSKLIKRLDSGILESKIDILVATPGRLVEHIKNTEGFTLQHLKFLVIDEADIVLEKTSNNWLNHLNEHLKAGGQFSSSDAHQLMFQSWPQKLLFSATLSFNARNFESLNLYRPKFIIAIKEDCPIGKQYYIPTSVTEYFCVAGPDMKPLVIYDLVVEKKWNKILIFTNSNEEAHRLNHLLNFLLPDKKSIAEITSYQSVFERTEAIRLFQEGKHDILVTTDRMARGIDFPDVNYVISYDPAKFYRTYVHRAGRTGRAGKTGIFVTILSSDEQAKLFRNRMVNLNRVNVLDLGIDLLKYDDERVELQRAVEKLALKIKEEQNSIAAKVKSEKISKQVSKNKKKNAKKKKNKTKKISDIKT